MKLSPITRDTMHLYRACHPQNVRELPSREHVNMWPFSLRLVKGNDRAVMAGQYY